MKTLLTSICLFFLTFVTLSQSPLGFNYQSIIRDDAGMIKKNESVSIGFEILDSSQNSIYSETHTTTTNDYGLVNLVIGEGTTSDDFSSIDWSSENYSIKVTYGSEDMGTTKFMSVPYAMSASNGITTAQADAITANTAKTGITTAQADAIIANTAKTGITTAQAAAITANTAKTGITTTQADAITANTAKVAGATATEIGYLSGVTSAIQTQLDAAGGASNITGLSDALVENNSLYFGNDPSSTTDLAGYNVAVGITALDAITTGDYNVAVGYNALTANTQGGSNTASGHGALRDNTTGASNTAIGHYALRDNTTGNSNTAIGTIALYSNTLGVRNTASGYYALQSNTTGNYNTASGAYALRSNTEGDYNLASGYQALLSNTTGAGNIAMGTVALYSNTTGTGNTAIGYRALVLNTSGNYNTALGYDAGDIITSGDNNVILGYNANPSANNASNQIVIGKDATGQGDNYAVIGNADVSRLYVSEDGAGVLYANGTIQSSDARLKENILSLTHGLDFIMKLNPVSYLKMKVSDYFNSSYSTSKNMLYEIGLLAQEVKEISEELDFDNKIVSVGEDGIHRMDYQKIMMPMIKAIQEQQQMIEELQDEVQTLKSMLNE